MITIPLNLKRVLGAFRILERRSKEEGQIGFALWTRTGATAVLAIGASVAAWSYSNECSENEMAAEVVAMLSDGKIDARELRRLRRIAERLKRCAERSHDISEAMRTA